MYCGPLVAYKPIYYLRLHHPQNQFLLPPGGMHASKHTSKEVTMLASDNLMVKLMHRKTEQEATETMETLPKLPKQKSTVNCP